MRSSRRPTILILAAALALAPGAANSQNTKKQPTKPATPPKKEAPTAQAADAKDWRADLSKIPILKGAPQRGLHLPMRDERGKMRMLFEIGEAVWQEKDQRNIEMRKMKLQFFDAQEKEESSVELPDAVLNKDTGVITAKTKVTIRRDDFELTGNSLTYDVDKRDFTLGGGVKMTIFDTDKMTGTKSGTKVEFSKPDESKDEPKKK